MELLALLENCTYKQVADYYKVSVGRISQVRRMDERETRTNLRNNNAKRN